MDKNLMLKESYSYNLPDELIAQEPIDPRDSSRLLVFDRDTKQVKHKIFRDITEYFRKGDVLVINTSKVIPARLFGVKECTGASIEILLHKRIDLSKWEIIAKPFKRIKVGTIIQFSDELKGEITFKGDEGICEILFVYEGVVETILDKIGSMPLPPYIKKKLKDKDRYQTVYSDVQGSSAAPTAGLHFTNELLSKIQDLGVAIVDVILHVGLGTFRPVKEDNIKNHKMHSEHFELTQENAEIINNSKKNGGRIFACGTTSVRVLESCAKLVNEKYELEAKSGDTNIFIYPSYEFKIVDSLITNFHLPESTLLMLISAFAGFENVINVYNIAIEEKYRFFSFGDATLFL